MSFDNLASSFRSEVWDSLRQTGYVTSDQASECSDAVMKAIANFLAGDEAITAVIMTLEKLTASRKIALRKKNDEASKNERRDLNRAEYLLSVISKFSMAERRNLLIAERASVKESSDNLDRLLNRKLIDKKSHQSSKAMHNNRLEELDSLIEHIEDTLGCDEESQ